MHKDTSESTTNGLKRYEVHNGEAKKIPVSNNGFLSHLNILEVNKFKLLERKFSINKVVVKKVYILEFLLILWYKNLL